MKNRVFILLGAMTPPLCLFAVFFFLVSPTLAKPTAVFTVNSAVDTDDGLCNISCTLREAINAANTNGGHDTIQFDLPTNSTIVLAGTQLPVITDSLYIDGNTAVSLTISGNNASRVFEIGTGTAVSLTHLTLSEGLVTSTHPISDGGAIYIHPAAFVTIANSTITNNVALNDGGGIFNENGIVTINNSVIQNNHSYDDGGGIASEDGNITITESDILNNSSDESGGGFNAYATMIRLESTIFSNNQAGNDGAGLNGEYSQIIITDSIFSNNQAIDDGGGLLNNHGSATIDNSAFISNSTGDKGGGFYNRSFDARAALNNTTFMSNTAREGAGIRNFVGDIALNSMTIMSNVASDEGGGLENLDGSVFINNSTFAHNEAFNNGGGINSEINSISEQVHIQNSTLSANSSNLITGTGGGCNLEDGIAILTNTTTYSNSAGIGGGLAVISGTINLTNNLIGGSLSGGDCVISDTLGVNTNNLIEDNSCSSTISGDAKVGPLAHNGGNTLTHALLTDSLAINAGDNSSCPNTDQRGRLRLTSDGGICDIGAYEISYPIFLPVIVKN